MDKRDDGDDETEIIYGSHLAPITTAKFTALKIFFLNLEIKINEMSC